MLSSMTLAEIQAKYSGIHTPEEIEQFHQNMTTTIWSDEMYPWPQPEVVRLKMRGMPEICVS